MGLIIVLTKQPDREWFTSFDDVCGTVIFTNKRHANVKRIVVYLEGRFDGLIAVGRIDE